MPWRWLGVLAVSACGQELVLPEGAQRTPTAPSEGVTGVAGAADEGQPPPRLPVTNEPVFTSFGGAGGDASVDADGGEAATPRTFGGSGGTTSVAGAAGGGRLNGGGGGSGGNANFGGAAGTGGKTNLGGAAGSGGKANLGGAATSGGQSNGAGSGTAGAEVVSGGDAGGAAGAAATLGHALLFSEYVEGSGSYKALEIVALDTASLEGCALETYFNGKTEPSRLALHGQLARGETHVLCSTELAKALPSACSRATNLTFNGDDAVALSCEGELLDVIGEIGVDPGDSWDMGATLDHTLRRRCEVTAGRRDASAPFAVDAEWLTFGVDTFSDLGLRSCAP